MVASVKTLLAVATTASAAVLDLPVVIRNSYSSVKINVGTPPKEHRLLFDTGSSTSFMTNTDCTNTSCPDYSAPYYIRQPYNVSASSSAVDLNIPAKIPYLGGDVAGGTIEDIFSIPGTDTEWNQTFLSANESSWQVITADGFLGMGFSSIAEKNTTTVVEQLMQDGLLDAPRFGLYYGKNLSDNAVQNGVLTLGGSHEDKYVEGSMAYAPLLKVDEYQLWSAPLRSINFLMADNPSDPNSTVEIHNGRLPTTIVPEGTYPNNITWPLGYTNEAIFDTGAGGFGLPTNAINGIYFAMGWDLDKLYSREERFECKHLNASWAITITLGEGDPADDVSFSLRGDQFLLQSCQPPFYDNGYQMLVGTAFLQSYYSVFDFGSDKVESYAPRVGFGKLKEEYQPIYQ